MLYSYKQAQNIWLPSNAKKFINATQEVPVPTGVVLGSEAMQLFMENNGLIDEITKLTKYADDEESKKRVDEQIRNLVVTAKIPAELSSAITECFEILSIDQSLRINNSSLVATLFVDKQLNQPPVIINIVTKKDLADALRILWSRIYSSPYPSPDIKAVVIIYNMPFLNATVTATGREKVVLKASLGWGQLVGYSEGADTYIATRSPIEIIQREISHQNHMISYNPRTKQVIKTTTSNPSDQKITDSMISEVVRQHRKTNAQESVFGIKNDSVLLLNIIRSEQEGEVENISSEQNANISIKELDSKQNNLEETSSTQATSTTNDAVEESIEISNADINNQVIIDSIEFDEPLQSKIYEEKTLAEEYETNVETQEATGVNELKEEINQNASKILELCVKVIERRLRDWLYDDHKYESFIDLVNAVSAKKTVPYKQRIITLYEMKKQGVFANPSAEDVRFGLETIERFLREF